MSGPGSRHLRVTGHRGVAARNRIRRRDSGVCQLCGRLGAHVDHVVPLSQGGSDDDENKQLLCVECHDAKSRAERGLGAKGCDVDGNPTGGWKA